MRWLSGQKCFLWKPDNFNLTSLPSTSLPPFLPFLWIYSMCVCVCIGGRQMPHGTSVDIGCQSVLSFYHVDSCGNRTQAIRFGNKHLHPLSYFSSSNKEFLSVFPAVIFTWRPFSDRNTNNISTLSHRFGGTK